MNQNNELIMYFIINKDLNMSPGKIAAQVAHAAVEETIYIKNANLFERQK